MPMYMDNSEDEIDRLARKYGILRENFGLALFFLGGFI